jgi:hypothetical protein
MTVAVLPSAQGGNRIWRECPGADGGGSPVRSDGGAVAPALRWISRSGEGVDVARNRIDALVIFGVTGDLAELETFPAVQIETLREVCTQLDTDTMKGA